MNLRKSLLVFAAILGLTGQAFAQAQATEATVARVTGTVTATLPDGSTVTVTEGSKLPQGATITTGDKSEAYLVSHGDTTSVITSNSVVAITELSTTSAGGKVTEQKATLDLKSGNLVAKLNPNKKAVNNYSVRTPKGVAAARGTIFTVSYKGGNYAISVVNGVVTVIPPAGGVVQVSAGETSAASGNDALTPVSSGQMNNSNAPEIIDLRELLAVAVATVTLAAQNNIGGTTAAEAAAVAKAVFTAVPGAAEQAGALIKASNDANPPANPTTAAAVLDAVTTATPAAAQGAFTSGTTTGTFTPSTANTSTDTPSTNSNPNSNSNSPNQITTPQPIDPTTVSRSGE